MAMTFTTLTGAKTVPGSIQNFVRYARVPGEVVLEEAQSLIYQRLRVREMKAASTVTIALDGYTSALPSRLLEVISMQDREGWNVYPDKYISDDQMLRRRLYDEGVLETGTPMYVAIFGELFQWDCKAEEARTLDIVYYQSLPLLAVTSNETNFLTTRYPNILRVACLAGAASFMKDDNEEAKQLAKLTALCDLANMEADQGRAA